MITLTDAAVAQIRRSIIESNADNMGLRLAAKVNSAGMIEFGIGFDNERENDQVVDTKGITLLISQHSRDLLADVTLDFTKLDDENYTFVFMKPTEAESEGKGCSTGGCGTGGCGGGSCGT